MLIPVFESAYAICLARTEATVKLDEYFQSTKGRGVLGTADRTGMVNLAVYARPHFVDDRTVAFIMTERLTHENLRSNPWAAYLFTEEESRYEGKRLYLKKTNEEENSDLAAQICRRCDYPRRKTGRRYVVYFSIERVLPLIGGGDPA
jgi:hypothetical protein